MTSEQRISPDIVRYTWVADLDGQTHPEQAGASKGTEAV